MGLSVEAEFTGTGSPQLSGKAPVGRLDIRDRKSGDHLVSLRGGALLWTVEGLVLHPTDPLQTAGTATVNGALPAVELPSSQTSLAVPSLRLRVVMRGKRKVYDADMDMAVRMLAAAGKKRRANMTTTMKAHADLRQPAARMQWRVRGPEGPKLTGKLDARYARKQRAVIYDASFSGEKLALIEKFLPAQVRREHQVDWRALEFSGTSSGDVKDVVVRVVDGVEPILAKNPLAVARGEQTLTITVVGLDYRTAEQSGEKSGKKPAGAGAADASSATSLAVATPELVLRFDASQNAGPLRAVLDVESPRIDAVTDGDTIAIVGLSERVELSSTAAVETGRLELSAEARVQKVSQDIIGYPVEDAHLTMRGHIEQLASLHLEKLRFENAAGGTTLQAELAMDRLAPSGGDNAVLPGRQALAFFGTLEQDVSKVSLIEKAPRMRGRLEIPFRVESGDLTAFLVAARAKVDGVHATLPEAEVTIQGFSGDIPVVLEVAVLPDGSVRPLKGPPGNVYSRTRFLDVHPFLRGQHYLAIDRVKVKDEVLGPVAGNLRIDRDVLALDQLQMGYRGGNISGQLVVDDLGRSPRMMFRGNITGVRPSKGKEILNANAALSFSPQRLDLEGRVQIVRIGRDHLREVLNVLDPYREDP